VISKLSTCILRLLISTILRSKSDAVYAFGLVCSSFVSVSRGSTFRHYFLPLGDPSSASAQLGNLLCARSPRVGNIRYHIVGYIYHIYISFMWVVSLVNIFLWAQGIYCQLEVDQALLWNSPPSKPQLGALALLAGWYWHSSSSCREVGCGCWSSQYPVWFFATQDFGNCCAEPRHLDYHYNI